MAVLQTEQIRHRGWRQGSIVGSELATKLDDALSWKAGDGRELVVISQDCDVVHRSLDVEPKVEMIAATRTPGAASDAALAHGKNPRWLQLGLDGGERLEFSVQERYVVDRAWLGDHDPAGHLDVASTRLLATWLAKRYVRSAFPDHFNDRIDTKAEKKINKALKAHGEGASGIFLLLDDWGELDEGEDYEAVIIVVCPVRVLDDPTREDDVAKLAPRLMEILNSCEGLSVQDARHVGEDEFTIHDFRSYKRWDFDFRSHSGRPGGEVAPNA